MRLNKIVASLIAASSLAGAGAALAAPNDSAVPAQQGPADPGTPAVDQSPATSPGPVANAPVTSTPAPAPAPVSPTTAAPAPQAQAPAPTDGGAVAQAQTPAAPATADPQVTAFVNTQFAQADVNGDGQLTPDEFGPWMSKLKSAELQQGGKPVVQAEVNSYASMAFARADSDKNNAVTKTELTQFLKG